MIDYTLIYNLNAAFKRLQKMIIFLSKENNVLRQMTENVSSNNKLLKSKLNLKIYELDKISIELLKTKEELEAKNIEYNKLYKRLYVRLRAIKPIKAIPTFAPRDIVHP